MVRILTCVCIVLLAATPARATPINAVIGDASWRAGDPERAGETARIQVHLRYVLAALRARDVTGLAPAQRRARAQALAALARYIERGAFPRRTGDPYGGRRPRFIDDRGVHCAVGQLIADAGDEPLAQAIARDDEYAYVADMRSPSLVAWAGAHGFTLRELAMIQPTYSAPPTEGRTREEIKRLTDSTTIACAVAAAPDAKLALRVVGDKRGHVQVTPAGTSPFAACFATTLTPKLQDRGAWDTEPRTFSFDVTIAVPALTSLFGANLELVEPGQCAPRPGPLARAITVQVHTGAEGLRVEAASTPRNAEIETCVADMARRYLSRFGAGTWDLAAQHTFQIPARVSRAGDFLGADAAEAATACFAPGLPAKIGVTVTAQPDDPDFTVAVTGGDAAFAACVRDRVIRKLHGAFEISRPKPDGGAAPYFRIDAPVRSSASVAVESPAARDERVRRALEDLERRKRR